MPSHPMFLVLQSPLTGIRGLQFQLLDEGLPPHPALVHRVLRRPAAQQPLDEDGGSVAARLGGGRGGQDRGPWTLWEMGSRGGTAES